MRVLAYSFLTQAILWLGRLRERIVRYHPETVRRDRVFDVYSLESWDCCDCGLTHRFRAFSDPGAVPCNHMPAIPSLIIIGHTWPIRPKGYSYRLRSGAKKPSLAQEQPE